MLFTPFYAFWRTLSFFKNTIAWWENTISKFKWNCSNINFKRKWGKNHHFADRTLSLWIWLMVNGKKSLPVQWCIHGVPVSMPPFWTEGRVFKFGAGKPATTHGESSASYILASPLGTDLWVGKLLVKRNPWSNDCFERTNAGSCAPMVSNYSRCVVLGSGPA